MSRRRLAEAFGAASLDAFGSFTDAEAVAAALALDYVRATQAGTLPRLGRPSPQGETGVLAMDAATRASLELLRARDGGTLHTLISAVQRTATAPGARLLAVWLSAPLTDPAAIGRRQDAWGWLLANPEPADRVRAALRAAPDMARALGRLSLGRGGPRDLAALRDGLLAARTAAAALAGPLPALLAEALRGSDHRTGARTNPHCRACRSAAAPAGRRRHHPAGLRSALDAERSLRDDSRRVLATLQLDFAQRYGVASLKIRHHAQLGYVIEVPAVAVEKLRDFPELTLRQGMASGARFTTPELANSTAASPRRRERAAARERAVFAHLVRAALDHADALAAGAEALAVLDVAAIRRPAG